MPLTEEQKREYKRNWAFYYHRVCLPLTREDVVKELNAQGIDVENELHETKLY